MSHGLEALDDTAFRSRLRDWLEDNCPPEWRDPALRLRGEDARTWQRQLYDGGWRAPAWPREWGGMGISIAKQIAYNREMEAFGVARTLDHGVRMVGPILMAHGTRQQQKSYLQPMLTGEHQWCQGYSEPGAGSDLANLSMRAERQGDSFFLTGQKIWTTQAADATHIYVLARSSNEDRKQRGITLFLLRMDSPGLTLRPIRNLMDEEEFYEVFFDAVPARAEDVVGEVGGGWSIAKALLGFERFTQGSPALARHAMKLALKLAASLPDYALRLHEQAIIELRCDLHDATVLFDDICSQVARGDDPLQQYSIAKLVSAELFQRIGERLQAMAGENGAPPELRRKAQQLFLLSRPVTIFGGTAEVQRNLLAREILGR